ncbi:hypothetical protein [Solibacillus ferritrahens]|uniref:hypothetical protein n=1 Tax=Solibacillus ferritrahens TaxID=3098620 RepID=UPI00300B5158
MKLFWAWILLIIGIGLASITFEDIPSGWNTLLTFLGAGLVLFGIITIGNRTKKNSL